MADLLECLIQIKGLADTPRRLDVRLARAARADAVDDEARLAAVVERMVAAERLAAECLALMLEHDRPALPSLRAGDFRREGMSAGRVDEWQVRFHRRRAETVASLERCTAGQLSRIGLEPSRGPMTVADLVAVLLAHDTDCLGEL